MKNLKKNYFKKSLRYKGYSLIEGIIAVVIVTIGMLAVIQLMTANLNLLINSRNQTLATFLGQEGIEIVRNIRDNNWASERDTFANFPASSAIECRIDLNSSNACMSGGLRLYKRIADGVYSHASSGSSSIFQRRIIIKYNTNSRNTASSATVTSVVTWNSSSPPPTDPNSTNCNLYKKCVFVSVTLSKWGGSD